MYHTIIFYRANPPAVSPALSLEWSGKVVDLLNRLPPDVWVYGDRPERLCAAFVAACCADLPQGLWALPLRRDRLAECERAHGGPLAGAAWVRWLSDEFGGGEAPPVLIDLDPPYHATRGGTVLCRRLGADEPGGPRWVQVAELKGGVAFGRFGTEYGEFSNFAPYPVKIDRRIWPSAEHYFQAQKFEDPAYREKIRKADFVVAPRLARDQEQKVRPDWEAVNADVLRSAVRAKFSQYNELRTLLLSTDAARLVGKAEGDHWREPGERHDDNLLGRVLMEVRAELRVTRAASARRRGRAARGNRPPVAATADAPETGTYRTILFFSDPATVSPAVRVCWPGEVVDLFNRLRNVSGDDAAGGWCGGGNMPDGWCVEFVAACWTMPEIGPGRVEVHNLPPCDPFDDPIEDGQHAPGTPEFDKARRKSDKARRKWLFKQLRRLSERDGTDLPVLIDTFLPGRAMQGGKQLFRMAEAWERESGLPLWVPSSTRARRKPTPPRRAAATTGRSTVTPPAVPLYGRYTVEEGVARFGDPSSAAFYCDRQFAIVGKATLCFATMGDAQTGTRVQSPSLVVWKPGRLNYHPKHKEPWLPRRLTRCVERNGGWLPLHHLFLRAPGDQPFVYAGIAELPVLGDMPETDGIAKAAHFYLDYKLPRDLWLRLGGYDWLAAVNGKERRFAAADVAGFKKMLAEAPTNAGHWQVTLTGYEEWSLTMLFNDRRAYLSYRPLYWPFKQGDERCLESWDPNCAHPRRDEFFGNGAVVPARRTVPRTLAVRAAVEHFRTGRLPEGVRWRQTEQPLHV